MADDPQTATATPAEGSSAPAADGAAPAEGEAAAAGGGKKKMLMMIGAGVAVLALLGGLAAFFLMTGKPHEEEPQIDPNAAIVMLDVPPIAVDMLDNGDGQTHFMKTKIALEIQGEKDKIEAEKLLPRLQDDWNNFLRQLRPDDIEGSAAMQRIKEALLLRANQVLSPVVVRNVLFRELLVQ